MKKNIEVNEKALIDRLNGNVNKPKHSVNVDTAEGEDKTTVTRWDNNGPVQFEEQNTIDPETYKVGENFKDNKDKYYDKDVKVREKMVTLQPRNTDGTFAPKVIDVEYNAKEVAESRVNCDNKKPLAEIKKTIDELKGTRSRTCNEYEEVNHPDHYNQYDVEVIDMMERIFGKTETAIFCKLNAFKYRQRMGLKPGQDVLKDLAKEKWYLDKKRELERK